MSVCQHTTEDSSKSGKARHQPSASLIVLLESYGLGKASEPKVRTVDGETQLYIEYILGEEEVGSNFCEGYPRTAVVTFECPRDVHGFPIGGVFGAPVFDHEASHCQVLKC